MWSRKHIITPQNERLLWCCVNPIHRRTGIFGILHLLSLHCGIPPQNQPIRISNWRVQTQDKWMEHIGSCRDYTYPLAAKAESVRNPCPLVAPIKSKANTMLVGFRRHLNNMHRFSPQDPISHCWEVVWWSSHCHTGYRLQTSLRIVYLWFIFVRKIHEEESHRIYIN